MKIASNKDILGLFSMVNRTPHAYRRLIVCAPFISPDLLYNKIAINGDVRVPTIVITTPDTACKFSLLNQKISKRFTIRKVLNLHAKIYLACGISSSDSIAIIGSYNFTMSALYKNFELGIRLGATLPQTHRIILCLEKKLLSIS
jgi:phosphatidylserine/phosphatidylglycerophosphate/cardiolipin synthase-like enzyme